MTQVYDCCFDYEPGFGIFLLQVFHQTHRGLSFLNKKEMRWKMK